MPISDTDREAVLKLTPEQWNRFSVQEQEYFRSEGAVPRSIQITQPGPLGLQLPAVGDEEDISIFNKPLMDALKRLGGGAYGAGLGALAGGGIPGAVIGGAGGMLFPPKNIPEAAGMAAGIIPGGRAFPHLAKAMSRSGALKSSLAAGGLGAGEVALQHATQRGTEMGLGRRPFEPSELLMKPTNLQDAAALLAGFTIPGAMASATRVTSPVKETYEFAEGLAGKSPQQLKNIRQGLSQVTPEQRRQALTGLQGQISESDFARLSSELNEVNTNLRQARLNKILVTSDPGTLDDFDPDILVKKQLYTDKVQGLEDQLRDVENQIETGKVRKAKQGLTKLMGQQKGAGTRHAVKLRKNEVALSSREARELGRDAERYSRLARRGRAGLRQKKAELQASKIGLTKEGRPPASTEELRQIQQTSTGIEATRSELAQVKGERNFLAQAHSAKVQQGDAVADQLRKEQEIRAFERDQLTAALEQQQLAGRSIAEESVKMAGFRQQQKALRGQLTAAKGELKGIEQQLGEAKSSWTAREARFMADKNRISSELASAGDAAPGIRLLFKADGPEEVMRNIYGESGNAVISDFMRFHQGRQGGQESIKKFKDMILERWIADMYDQRTGILGNIENLTKPNSGLDQQKLAMLFQSSEDAQKVMDLLGSIHRNSQGILAKSGMLRRGIHHWMYTLPYAILMHPAHLLGPGPVSLGTLALVGIGWPKLIDRALRNPKFYTQFKNYLDTGATQSALIMAPEVAKEFIDNGTQYHVPRDNGNIVRPGELELPQDEINRLDALMSQ